MPHRLWLKYILDFVHKYNMCTSKTLPKKDRFTVRDVDDIMKNGDSQRNWCRLIGELVQAIKKGKEDIVKN